MGYKDKDKQREYQRLRVARTRAEYLSGKSCAVCSSVSKLEIDHIDPTTKVSHNIWSWSPARRSIELDKCQILCHDCHVTKTIQQLPTTHGFTAYQHGTQRTYDRGCRCDTCRAAKKVKNSKRSRRIS